MAKMEIPIRIDGIEIIEQLKKEGKLVTVIRCKDCKYHEIEDFAYGLCSRTQTSIMPDDFCSYAEPMEEDNPLDKFFNHPLEDISELLEGIQKGEKE